MRYDGKLGILVFLIATVVLLSTSLFITPLAVSDADPSTYVIVPMLMLPLFVLFSLKAGADPDVGRRDVAIGSAMFAAFILLTLFLRFYFSFLFLSFRMDLLVLPLALAALAVLLFGTRNLGKFRGVILYALFASPPVLFLLLESYNAFTSINSVIVYGLLRPFVAGVKYVAPITISANGYNIGIGQACVSIGIFIALALFLVPVAYLYDGKDSKKAAWVASGVALLFAFNIFRMLFVSYEWLAYGPSEHNRAGARHRRGVPLLCRDNRHGARGGRLRTVLGSQGRSRGENASRRAARARGRQRLCSRSRSLWSTRAQRWATAGALVRLTAGLWRTESPSTSATRGSRIRCRGSWAAGASTIRWCRARTEPTSSSTWPTGR